jgi:hypothetical protein
MAIAFILSTHRREAMKVSDLLASQLAAERLVKLAADAMRTFFVREDDYPLTFIGDRFVGFMRDTIPAEEALEASTGGLGVVASLSDLERHLGYGYLKGLSSCERLDALTHDRDKAARYVCDLSRSLALPASFGFMNAHSAASFSMAMVNEPPTARTAIFVAAAASAFVEGWPPLNQVEKPHPFVAHNVLRAMQAFEPRIGTLAAIADPLAGANVRPKDRDKKKYQEWKKSLPKQLQILERLADSEALLDGAYERYETQAKDYLWEQLGYLGGPDGRERFHLYDPVGACFALAVLVRIRLRNPQQVSRLVGEHGELIARSVQHIVASISSAATMPFGLPFTYHEKGMGGFATSISGITVLASALLALFEQSRRDQYSDAEYLASFVETLDEPLRKLLRLTATLEGTERSVAVDNLPHDLPLRTVRGWSTDRALNSKRIESWVTIDVLVFAACVRLLAQEIAQFMVMRQYNGALPQDAPKWPYKRESDTDAADPQPKMMFDPDEPSATAPSGPWEQCPVQYLHRNFRKFMDGATTEWKSKVSSVLMFGPPGTSKSTIVNSLAAALKWPLIELTPSHFVIGGPERIEERARAIFDDLSVLRECVVLFDELDSLLVDRDTLGPGSILSFSVPAMLPKLQRLAKLARKQRVLLVFATNFYDRLDAAMVRRGRVDQHLVVLPYNEPARRRVIEASANSLSVKAIDTAANATPLRVYEDVVAYAEDLSSGGAVVPPATVTPWLYESRVPRAKEAIGADGVPRVSKRAIQRVAVEIAEVIGRLLEQPRELPAEPESDVLRKRLQQLETQLRNTAYREWENLCKRVLVHFSD